MFSASCSFSDVPIPIKAIVDHILYYGVAYFHGAANILPHCPISKNF